MNNSKPPQIINADILGQIENYVRENDNFTFKRLGFANEIAVNGYSVPSSFDYDEARSQLKQLKYKNLLNLLNSSYKKMGIASLSKKEFDQCIAAGSEYWYLHISFETPVPLSSQVHLKIQPHNFMFFLTNYEEGKNTDFKMMYSSEIFIRYTEAFDRAIYLDLDATELDEKYQSVISQLESVIYGICKRIEIEIPQDLQSETLDLLIVQPPTLATFELLLKLITRDLYKDSVYRKDAKKLQKAYGKVTEEDQMHWEVMSTLATYEMTYDSDWKFDPEDIEYGISTMLGAEFSFEYPEDTYSHGLFPHIQTELAKQELTLMNIDTGGDSYLFCIVNIIDVDRILELAQSIDLKIERI
jgi:hypothetical protein